MFPVHETLEGNQVVGLYKVSLLCAGLKLVVVAVRVWDHGSAMSRVC